MATIRHPPKDKLRANLRSLVEFCSVDKSNPKDCPLYLLRQMERPQRLAWINALPEDDLVYLATYHHICLNTKTAFKPEI
jgi:uncharacterized protein with von Willebrand factor type A (vWA) domain